MRSRASNYIILLETQGKSDLGVPMAKKTQEFYWLKQAEGSPKKLESQLGTRDFKVSVWNFGRRHPRVEPEGFEVSGRGSLRSWSIQWLPF